MNCTLGINYICIATNSQPTFNSTFFVENEETWYLRGLTTTISQEEQRSSILLLDVARYTGWIENNTVFRAKNLLNNVDCSLPFINDYTFISTRAGEMKCFATLVSPSLMLSTASCLENSSVPDLYGTSGDHTSQIKNIIIHPSYNGSTRPHNLAIVQLDSPLDTTPFCILFDTSRTGSRLRLLLPTKGPKKYFFDLDESQPCDEGHVCGHFRGIAQYSGDPSCKENFHGSPLFHDFGDGRGVFLRGLLVTGKEDHCEQPEILEVFVDVMFYAGWIRETVLRIQA